MTIGSPDQHEVTWQFEKCVFPTSKDLRPLHLADCWLTGGDSACKRLNHHRNFVNVSLEGLFTKCELLGDGI